MVPEWSAVTLRWAKERKQSAFFRRANGEKNGSELRNLGVSGCWLLPEVGGVFLTSVTTPTRSDAQCYGT